MEIGMEEARELYKKVPEQIKKTKEHIDTTQSVVIGKLWVSSDNAIQKGYEILTDYEKQLNDEMGWKYNG